jgi:hypothetical protein
MIGQIWTYDEKTRNGSIVSRDNQEYFFLGKDYQGSHKLGKGHMVSFELAGKLVKDVRWLTTAPVKP